MAAENLDGQLDENGRLRGYNVTEGYLQVREAIKNGDYNFAIQILEGHPEVGHYLSGKEEDIIFEPLLNRHINRGKRIRSMQTEVAISEALDLEPRGSVLLSGGQD